MGQAAATLEAPIFKHVAAGFGGHAFHKTVFAAALAFFGLISLLRHRYYPITNTYQLSTIHYKLGGMISRKNRFHGYNSLRNAYRNGRMARGSLFAVKAVPNPRRSTYRLAVVVSRKVNKSAVARNRIRRRLYEISRQLGPQISQPHDIVITVFHSTVLETPHPELAGQLKKQFKELGLIS
jgi:ribonuclease P protein component